MWGEDEGKKKEVASTSKKNQSVSATHIWFIALKVSHLIFSKVSGFPAMLSTNVYF